MLDRRPVRALALFASCYVVGMSIAAVGCDQGGNESASVCGRSPDPGVQPVVFLLGLVGLVGVFAVGAPRAVRATLIVLGALTAPVVLAVPSLVGLG